MCKVIQFICDLKDTLSPDLQGDLENAGLITRIILWATDVCVWIINHADLIFSIIKWSFIIVLVLLVIRAWRFNR